MKSSLYISETLFPKDILSRDKMPVDALAKLLHELQEAQSVPASRVSASMTGTLKSLFDFGVLTRRRSGAGFRIHVENPEALQRFIDARYPNGLHGIDTGDDHPKARAIATYGDSKRAARHDVVPLFLRGFHGANLHSAAGEITFPVATLTADFGLAALPIAANSDWTCESSHQAATLAIVENFESFLHVEKVLPHIDIALYAAGVLPDIALTWLKRSFPTTHFLHFPDYDPKGLAEFERAHRFLGPRIKLFVPDNFEDLLKRYGKKKLLRDSPDLFEGLHKSDLPVVREVARILHLHGKGLEQEALLL